MSTLTATNTNKPLGTNSKFTFTFSEGEYNARFLNITNVRAEDPKGTFQITDQVTPGPAVEFNWNPNDATFQSRVKDRITFNINVVVNYVYEYQEPGSSTWIQREGITGVTITRSFTDAMKPSVTGLAFSILWDNAGTAVSTLNGYVAGYSKIKGTYNSSAVTLASGATVKYWYMNYGSSASRTGPTQTSATGSVYASTGNCSVTFYVEDSRGFTSNTITYGCTFVPFLTAGAVTAASANFGSSVAISYGITSGSGAHYVVTSSIPKTAGGNQTETIYDGTSASTSKTFNAETYAALITDRRSVTCTITVRTYSMYGTTSVLFATKTKQITLTFAEASYAPSVSASAFSIAWDNTGTSVSGISGYVAGYSKIRGTYNKSAVTLATGATVKSWHMVYIYSGTNTSNTQTSPGTTTATGNVRTATGTCDVLFYVTDSRGFASNGITKTCTFVPFLTAGAVTAASANFGSSVAISYGITSGSGAKYVVTSSVPKTAGGNKTESIYTGTSASTSKTFNAETYAALVTDRKTATCTITVKTYSTSGTTEVLFASKTKQITLTFAESSYAPVLNSGAFSISALNTGAASGRSGYIQGYSKIRATYDPSKVTLKTGATVKSLSVKFGSAAAAAMTVVTSGTSTKDSAVIRATTTVVCTLTDSRGFVKTASFTATIIPYAVPKLTASAVRTDSSGTPQDDGTYIKVSFSATYAAVATDQNTMAVKVYTKTIAASSYTDKGEVTGGSTSTSGTNKVYSKTVLYSGYSAATAFNVRVTATDRFGNTATKDFGIPTETWAIHIMTGLVNGARTVVGAAAGMMATVANRFQIPDGWKFYRGSHKVFDDGDVIPKANGGSGTSSGAVSIAGDTITGNLLCKSTELIDGTAPSELAYGTRAVFLDKNNVNLGYVGPVFPTDGRQNMVLQTRRVISGTAKVNNLQLIIDEEGNNSVSFSEAAQWRKALGLCYAKNDTMAISQQFSVAGRTNADSKIVYITVTTSKSMENISTITVTSLSGWFAGPNGALNGSASSVEYVGNSSYTVTTLKLDDYHVRIGITKTSAFTNSVNYGAVVYFGSMTLKFT